MRLEVPFQLQLALNPAQARRSLRARRPDIVLADQHLAADLPAMVREESPQSRLVMIGGGAANPAGVTSDPHGVFWISAQALNQLTPWLHEQAVPA